MNRLKEWLSSLVARAPATIHQKLLAAFLSIVVLLIVVGAVGLEVLVGVNRHAEQVVALQRKIAAYRQLQHATTAQLYIVASALLVPDDVTLEATVRQLNQFGYDFDRLEFVARDEVALLAEVRKEYQRFIEVVGRGGHHLESCPPIGKRKNWLVEYAAFHVELFPRGPDLADL